MWEITGAKRGNPAVPQGCVSSGLLPSPSNSDSIALRSWALPEKIQLLHLQQHHPANFQLTKHGDTQFFLPPHTRLCADSRQSKLQTSFGKNSILKLLLSILLKYKTLLFHLWTHNCTSNYISLTSSKRHLHPCNTCGRLYSFFGIKSTNSCS